MPNFNGRDTDSRQEFQPLNFLQYRGRGKEGDKARQKKIEKDKKRQEEKEKNKIGETGKERVHMYKK